jgi:hypothetical protein
MQTSIEWFIEHLLGSGLLRLTKEDHSLYSELRDKAKQMHKKELVRNANQLKISNKEIESAANEHNRNGYFISPYSFAEGAKWYRKQLKRK